MNKTWIWIIAVVVTIATVIYQRKTGPTYPVASSVEISGEIIEIDLPRSHGGDSDREFRFLIEDEAINGSIVYKRFKTADPLDTVTLVRQGAELVGYLPYQPPAGKLEYRVMFEKEGKSYIVNKAPIVMRFKGSVPAGVLIPHILFIFIAELLSLIAGLFALFKLSRFKLYSWLTVISLFLGGFVLGPIIQKYAFGELWAGFPFGMDLTDNKVLFNAEGREQLPPFRHHRNAEVRHLIGPKPTNILPTIADLPRTILQQSRN